MVYNKTKLKHFSLATGHGIAIYKINGYFSCETLFLRTYKS
jgi:hypothetical protein